MKFWQSSHTFQHPWPTVTQAFWRKYPNEFNSVVIGTDVINRHIAPTGHLHSTRLIISRWGIPSWMKIFVGNDIGYAVEHSVIDPISQTLTLKSRNLTASSIFSMEENITYKSTQSGTSTELIHEAQIVCNCYKLLDHSAEQWIASTLGTKAVLGLKAMDSIIGTIENEALLAFKCVDEFTTDALKSVDMFATDAIKSVDELTTDALKSVDVFRTNVIANETFSNIPIET